MAPIKENLAAAIVMRRLGAGHPLLDPMWPGTLLIEAAMLATDRAPGLHRGHWGFWRLGAARRRHLERGESEAQTRARQAGGI